MWILIQWLGSTSSVSYDLIAKEPVEIWKVEPDAIEYGQSLEKNALIDRLWQWAWRIKEAVFCVIITPLHLASTIRKRVVRLKIGKVVALMYKSILCDVFILCSDFHFESQALTIYWSTYTEELLFPKLKWGNIWAQKMFKIIAKEVLDLLLIFLFRQVLFDSTFTIYCIDVCLILITILLKIDIVHGPIVVLIIYRAVLWLCQDLEAWKALFIRDIVDLRVSCIKLLANYRLVVLGIEEAGPNLGHCYYTDDDARAKWDVATKDCPVRLFSAIVYLHSLAKLVLSLAKLPAQF